VRAPTLIATKTWSKHTDLHPINLQHAHAPNQITKCVETTMMELNRKSTHLTFSVNSVGCFWLV